MRNALITFGNGIEVTVDALGPAEGDVNVYASFIHLNTYSYSFITEFIGFTP